MGYSKEKADEVYKELKKKGFHEGLCKEIAYKYMNTEYKATRMLGYLYRQTVVSEELVVDEMLAILEDCEKFRHKHEAKKANEAISRWYNER